MKYETINNKSALHRQICFEHVCQQRQLLGRDATVEDSFSVQTAGVYQFLLRALFPGVSRGTSAVTVTQTVLTTATRLDAPVSLLFDIEKLWSTCDV